MGLILVTGCGRSGTKYTATALQRLGMDVGHERLGRDGAVSSVWAVDADAYPSFHEQGSRPTFGVVLHQVRHPLDTIGSLTTAQDESWDFVCEHIPVERKAPLLQRCAEYWYHWNLLAERASIFTYRIEAMQAGWDVLMALVRPPQTDYALVTNIPTDLNKRDHPDVTWVMVKRVTSLYSEIREMARRYGYAQDPGVCCMVRVWEGRK